MDQGNIIQYIRFKNIDEKRNYFNEEIHQKRFMSKIAKKVCTALIYNEHLLILATTTTR